MCCKGRVTVAAWPEKPKIFTIQTFTEKVYLFLLILGHTTQAHAAKPISEST